MRFGRTLASIRASSSRAFPEIIRLRPSVTFSANWSSLLPSLPALFHKKLQSFLASGAGCLLHRRATENLKRSAKQLLKVASCLNAGLFNRTVHGPRIVTQIHQRRSNVRFEL